MTNLSRVTRSWDAWIATGLAFALAATVGFATRHFLVPASTPDSSLSMIWWVSVAIGVGGIVHWLAQARKLSQEWRALEELGRAGLGEQVDRLLKSRSISGDSVAVAQALTTRRSLGAGSTLGAEIKADLRRIAAERTAHYGATQRFVASALLLLAVMGTFAGLKGALPHLRGAIENETVQEGQVASLGSSQTGLPPDLSSQSDRSAKDIGSALDLVGNAFGANFMALLLSLVLGASGFGLARERRAMLVELDALATRAWYPLFVPDSGLSTLERAVAEMKGSAIEVGRVGDSIGALNSRLQSFQDTLVDALQTMVGDVRSSVQANAIATDRRQESQLTELARNLGLVTKVLERTAVGYEGLVKGLQERDLGVAEAAAALRAASDGALEVERSLSQGLQLLTSARKEWQARERELHTETTAVLHALSNISKRLEESSVRQSQSLESASGVVRASLEEQSFNWNLAHAAASERLGAAHEQMSRLVRISELLEVANSLGAGVRGDMSELHATIRQRADGMTVSTAKQSHEATAQRTALEATQEKLLATLHAVLDDGRNGRREALATISREVGELRAAVASIPAPARATLNATMSEGAVRASPSAAQASSGE